MQIKTLYLSLVILSAPALNAQLVSFGVKAGIPVTNAQPFQDVDTGRWLVGPTVELHLPLRFAIEADAIYRRWSSESSFNVDNAQLQRRSSTGSWQFPILLKYRILSGPITPFVSGGYEYNYLRTNSSAVCSSVSLFPSGPSLIPIASCPSPTFPDSESSAHRSGGVAAAGVEFKFGRFRLAPEARYTGYGSGAGRNQVAVMVGLTF